jgi:hypothetical protein
VCVEDSGVGIAPEQLPHVFDKFYQADNQARASAPGTGLGLAITKQIVEAHGGMIGAESTPDVGTRFVLLLPVDAPASGGTAAPTAGAAALTVPGDTRPAPADVAPTTALPPHTDGLADADVIALPEARRAEGALA